MTARPVPVVASGGADASATLTYSEALVDADGVKGNRNEVEGKVIRGIRDRFIFDGPHGVRTQLYAVYRCHGVR